MMRPLDWPRVSFEIQRWLRSQVDKAHAKGGVIGLSGGIDSSVVATLAVKALDRKNVLGLLMPESFTPDSDTKDARELARWLKIDTEEIAITKIVNSFPLDGYDQQIVGNIRARVRMTLLYFYANAMNRLVLGTGDRSEHLLGYFTKYGDGGTDLEPIGMLYKTEVRKLGKHLGLPEHIVNKPSSPQLYPGHMARQELPAEYEILDPILLEFDANPCLDDTDPLSNRIIEMHRLSEHKRAIPPSPW